LQGIFQNSSFFGSQVNWWTTYLVPRGVHNSVLCSFCCLTFLASNLDVTEKKQKTAKKQNNAHPSEPNRNSLQEPIGGRSKIPKGGRSVLAFSAIISMLKIVAIEQKGRVD
jgi:hypothetical protein